MSERFVSMWDNERDSDVVKRIRLSDDTNLFVITIIEHQSSVDYTMVMKILRYMVMIWTDYEKEMNAKYPGIVRTKDFKYPPILPIVYYEEDGTWTASTQLSDRIALAKYFQEFIPNYHYEVIRIHDYTNEEESLLLLLNEKGTLSGSLKESISTQTDIDVLSNWFKLALKVSSVSEFEEAIK